MEYELRISDWSSDVCSSDLRRAASSRSSGIAMFIRSLPRRARHRPVPHVPVPVFGGSSRCRHSPVAQSSDRHSHRHCRARSRRVRRSEEHTSELQSLMRISYAVFCLKKKQTKNHLIRNRHLINTHHEATTIPHIRTVQVYIQINAQPMRQSNVPI